MSETVRQQASQKCGVASSVSGAPQREQVAGKSHLVACRRRPERDCQLTVDIDVWEHVVEPMIIGETLRCQGCRL